MDAAPVDPLAAGVPRVLRHVGPPAAPWPAGIVRVGETTALLVDAELLPAGAVGAPADHLARPTEVFRTPTGHLVLIPPVALPVLPVPVEGIGGAITLAVSMLRGIAAADPEMTGQWWLSPKGRPLFVPVAGAQPIRPAAADLLRALDMGDDQPLFDQLAAELEDSDPLPLTGWEERVFALGRASAVRARPDAPGSSRRDRRRGAASASGTPTSRPARVRARGARERMSDAGTGLWRMVRRSRLRRRPLVIGTAAAAAMIVLGVGLTWPERSPAPQQVAVSASPSPARPGEAAEPEATGESADDAAPSGVAATAGDDLAAVAMTLMSGLRACGNDASCRAGLVEDPAKTFPAGPAVDAVDARATLIDDLGGIAVVRVDADAAGQIVLIVARDGKWLVRDVYDVADQP